MLGGRNDLPGTEVALCVPLEGVLPGGGVLAARGRTLQNNVVTVPFSQMSGVVVGSDRLGAYRTLERQNYIA